MFAKSIIIWDEGQQRKGLSLIDLTTTHNNKTEADCLFEPDSLPIDRECLSLDTVMGQILTAISNTGIFLWFRSNRHYSRKRFTEHLLDFCRFVEFFPCDFRRGLVRLLKYVSVLGDVNIAQIIQPKLVKTCDEGIILVDDVSRAVSKELQLGGGAEDIYDEWVMRAVQLPEKTFEI